MQVKQLLAALLGALLSFSSFAQQTQFSITGKILDESGEPIPGTIIQVESTSISSVSNTDGLFKIENLSKGIHALSVSAMGMETLKKKVEIKNGNVTLTFALKANATQMKTVSVEGHTASQEAKRYSYHITSIDTKPLQNTSQDLNQVIGKASGVRIREDGGLGSNFNFSLNGFSGKQVKFFLDGIPMENFGAALSLNNIPVNLADRIEIYKGVVPIWLGADALGGAVNVVSNNKIRNFLDVSYAYGSFNTHRAAVSAGYTDKKTGFLVLTNIFKNHSDNDYWVYTGISDLQTKQLSDPKRVRRFHDQYHSESLQLEAGITGKKYADRLLLGFIVAGNYKEIQTAAQMSRVYGGWYQRSTTIMPTFKYQKKDLIVKGLQLSIFGTYNFGQTQNVDTLNREYNWEGAYLDNTFNNGIYVPGGENARSLYKFKNNAAAASAGLNYAITKNHSLGFNYSFSNFNRKGKDVLRPQEESIAQPQALQKNILALAYKYDFDNRLSASVFGKYYLQIRKATQRVDIYTNPRWEAVKSDGANTGYGMAASYFFFKSLQWKGSYEKTYRLPDPDEVFGDGINQLANKAIRPESSDNINIGATFDHLLNENHRVSFDVTYTYRYAKDFIRVDVIDTRTQAINIRDVKNTGVDAQIAYHYKDMFNIGGNITYQKLINKTKREPIDSPFESPLYNVQIPNIPFLYGNAELGMRIKNWGVNESALGFSYHLNYVAEYYLKWPIFGNKKDKSVVPEQLSHDIAITYSLKSGRYNLSLECRNITDSRLYDNFLMQKPGRAWSIKLRYFISK